MPNGSFFTNQIYLSCVESGWVCNTAFVSYNQWDVCSRRPEHRRRTHTHTVRCTHERTYSNADNHQHEHLNIVFPLEKWFVAIFSEHFSTPKFGGQTRAKLSSMIERNKRTSYIEWVARVFSNWKKQKQKTREKLLLWFECVVYFALEMRACAHTLPFGRCHCAACCRRRCRHTFRRVNIHANHTKTVNVCQNKQ